MYEINNGDAPEMFNSAFDLCGKQLFRVAEANRVMLRPFKRTPTLPFAEHWSFMVGNQIYFVRIVDEAGIVEFPGSIQAIESLASFRGSHACVFPMHLGDCGCRAVNPEGWNLFDSQTGRSINPVELMTDEKIPCSAWEKQYFGLEAFIHHKCRGMPLLSYNGDPDVRPSVWYERPDGSRSFAVIEVYGHGEAPKKDLEREELFSSLKQRGYSGVLCRISMRGYEREKDGRYPIYRGEDYQYAFMDDD